MGCDSGSFRVVFLNPFQEHAHWVDRRLRAAPGCTCDPIVDGCVYVELRSHKEPITGPALLKKTQGPPPVEN